jgi:hypothetical protein
VAAGVVVAPIKLGLQQAGQLAAKAVVVVNQVLLVLALCFMQVAAEVAEEMAALVTAAVLVAADKLAQAHLVTVTVRRQLQILAAVVAEVLAEVAQETRAVLAAPVS